MSFNMNLSSFLFTYIRKFYYKQSEYMLQLQMLPLKVPYMEVWYPKRKYKRFYGQNQRAGEAGKLQEFHLCSLYAY